MKVRNNLLSILLAGACVIGGVFVNTNVVLAQEVAANTGYDYCVNITLTGADGFKFNQDAVKSIFGEGASISGETVVIPHVSYGTHYDVVLNDANHNPYLVTEPADAGDDGLIYYVKGLRVAGDDAIIGSEVTDKKDVFGNKIMNYPDVAQIDIKGDESYVVAYGVGQAVEYKVRYLDEAGNNLLPDDDKFGAKGRKCYVPSKHIDGYKPDALFKTNSKGLAKGDVFTFVYSENQGTVVVNGPDTVTEEYVEVEGEPKYEYQYNYNRRVVDGTTTNRAGNGGNRVGGDNAADDADTILENNDTENTAIVDEDVPKDVVDIAEDQVAKHGHKKSNHFARNIIIGIIIAALAIGTILVASITAQKKRKAEIARVDSKRKDKK
ncbi:MAG: hypothetical protein K6D38_10465 [Pseudobutyrivibrio sp.]|nr:hypothetical protein [Pseudobutyrivibrio sp.]